jgi:hypothetical protein
MPGKPTLEEKLRLLDWHINKPRGMHDVPVLKEIKKDVLKASPPAKVVKASDTDNSVYNEAMGMYRQFLKERNSALDMTGRKAAEYSKAMKAILEYIKSFAKQNDKPHGDREALAGWQYILRHWDRLNDFHRNRITLPDIQAKIEEIIPMIKNGATKRDQRNTEAQQLSIELAQRRAKRTE